MTHVFEIGGRYRTYQSEYEVLAIDGDKMTVRFAGGTEQRLTMAVQERIWLQVKAETVKPADPVPPARNAGRARRKAPAKPDASYHLADTPPHVARVIQNVYSRTGTWVSHDEIIAGLLNDATSRDLIDQAHAVNNTITHEAIATRFKAWFGRQFSIAGSIFARQFERTPSQPYGYRPQG